MQTSKIFACLAASVLVLVMNGERAQSAFVSFDFNYSGSVSVHNTLADAQNNTNSTGNYTISTVTNGINSTLPDARDGTVYADTDANAFVFLTSWWYTPQNHIGVGTGGYGNPNNTNNGFIQLYDLDGSSVNSLDIFWDATLTQFNVEAEGANAGASQFARFWPAPHPGGASIISGGTFHEYAFDLTATFPTPAAGPVTGILPDDVTGTFSAIFENTGTDPTYNGFYAISLLFGPGTVAGADNYADNAYAGYSDYSQSVADFAYIAPVPLPAALPLLAGGLGLAGLMGWSRRRRAPARN